MTEVNAGPSCSSLTRCATDVFGLKKAVQLAAIAFSSADTADEAEDVEEADAVADAVADGEDAAGGELLLLLQAATPRQAAHASRIQETNLRVITPTFSSFPLVMAMSLLTLTSARQRGRARRSAFPVVPGHSPGMAGEAAA